MSMLIDPNYGVMFNNGNIIDIRSAMPTSGGYVAGDIVLESTTIPGMSGWKRLTTGSGHVLNTDWAYFRHSTLVQANQNTLPGAATLISFTHGLGVAPIFSELEFVCLTAELGYSIGDVVTGAFMTNGTYGMPVTIIKSSTDVSYRTSSTAGWQISHRTTGVNSAMTLANWAWRFKVRLT